ncbi:MAG: exosortase-associated protein EpsI, V-type [Sphingomonas sp.]|jgi:EpsI family protein
MMDRRNLLLGAGCVAALGVSEWLKPRRALRLLRRGQKLADIIPARLGHWSIGEGGDIVVPQTPGSLSSQLYSTTLARLYQRGGENPADVMLLIAYGEAQSDLLQLHRPETCYPAIGFAITRRTLIDFPVARGVHVPAVALTAEARGRVENILYFTRLGEALPQTAREQRADRLRAAFAGYIGDGALVRASVIGQPGPTSDEALADFMRSMVLGMTPGNRQALIGAQRAAALATVA